MMLALNVEYTYSAKGTHDSQFRDKRVTVTTAWSVLGLRMKERSPI
jgi:hypothetical protein